MHLAFGTIAEDGQLNCDFSRLALQMSSMVSTGKEPKVCVVQDGARRHYSVPIAMQRAGILERVYTDWYAKPGSIDSAISKLASRINPAQGKSMAERFTPELDATKVISKPSLIIPQFLGRRRKRENEVEFFAEMSERMGRWILATGFGQANALYGFVRNIFPDVCEAARSQGLKIVTDQMIAPFEREFQESVLQAERFPGWSQETLSPRDRSVAEVESRTWASSDRVACASNYVRDGLIEYGVPAEKIVVLPPPFNSRNIRAVDRRGRSGPITVGFVGKVGLRKGAPYFLQVAKRFNPAEVKFVMVGPVWIDQAIAEANRGQVELAGAVPRSEISRWLEQFDMMLFPSTCEGSAGVVNEAMAAALPVITSPNSGSLVRDGVDGFITLYDDIDRMTDCVQRLAKDAELRHQMGFAGRARVEEFGIEQYGVQLRELYRGLLNSGVR